MSAPAWFVPFPPTSAAWEYSSNVGVTYTPSPAPSIAHGAGQMEVRRYRQVFTVPPGVDGWLRFTIAGDIFDAGANGSFGRFYLDGLPIDPNTGLTTGPHSSPYVHIMPGVHTFEWREGFYTGAGNTVPIFVADFQDFDPATVNPDCCIDQMVCYALHAACAVVPTQATVPSDAFDAAVLVSNAAGLTLGTNPGSGGTSNLGLLYDKSLVGIPSFTMGPAPAITGPTADIVIDLIASAPLNNVIGVREYSGYGGDLTDSDGIGPCTQVSLLNAAGGVIAGPIALVVTPGNANGPGALTVFPGGPFDGVSRVRFSGFCGQQAGVIVAMGLRELLLVQTYESTLTWICAPNRMDALIENDTGVGALTLSGGNTLTQVGGPHTMTFSAPAGQGFFGVIITNTPGSFSSLIVTDENPVITVTGNAVTTFTIAWELTSASPVRRGRLDLSVQPPVLYDMAGQTVPAGSYELVACRG